jgi:hypothetical protein
MVEALKKESRLLRKQTSLREATATT